MLVTFRVNNGADFHYQVTFDTDIDRGDEGIQVLHLDSEEEEEGLPVQIGKITQIGSLCWGLNITRKEFDGMCVEAEWGAGRHW